MRNEISMQTVVGWDPEQITTEIAGEVVAMSTRKGVYVGLDAMASAVWRRLEEPRTVEWLCGQLGRDYQGEAETITRDVMELLGGLREVGLLSVRGA